MRAMQTDTLKKRGSCFLFFVPGPLYVSYMSWNVSVFASFFGIYT